MNKKELQDRTKKFGLRVIKMIDHLPNKPAGRTVSNQIVRSATSVGANYRAALRARSKAEFISKLRTVLEEIDECCYWIEVIIESDMIKETKISDLHNEANELTAIFVSTIKTVNSNKILNLPS